jgi:Protein of unknown function (DUF2833)
MVNNATMADVDYIASRMRQEDIEECWALFGVPAHDALIQSFNASPECWVGEMDDKVFYILGCAPNDVGATLWMLFTNDVQYLPMSFFRQIKAHLQDMLKTYGRLSNYVNPKNTFILKLLKWLGFTIEPIQQINGLFAHIFHIEGGTS